MTEYDQARETANAATRAFRIVQTAYRAGNLSDADFLAERALHEAAQKVFDAAYAKEELRLTSVDPRPGNYYVSARNDAGAYWLMYGPLETHQAALGAVRKVQDLACSLDARGVWLSWGTCRLHDGEEAKPGKLNGKMQGNERA